MSRLPPPPPLLSVNLPIMDKTPESELTPTRLGFPNEFPYEFDSPAFSPGFTSPGNSTETEDESSDDEEGFLAGLTRRLAPSTHRLPPPSSKSEEKRQVAAATSPQSTLRSPIIPPPQPHTTSFKRDNAWDVISAAAGEVARLKLGSYEPHYLPREGPSPSLVQRRQNAAFQAERYINQQQRLLDQMWLCSQTKTKSSENHFAKRVANEEIAFQNLRILRRNASSNATWMPQQAVAPQKRPSTGTGVFIPRRYPTTTPSETIKKPAPVLQSKASPPQTLNFDEFTNVGSRLSQFDYECMLARSTLLARQGNFRAAGCLNQERRLPQDWMY